MNKKILVTGPTGLVGSHLIRLLLKQGHTHIVALHRPDSPMDLLMPVKDQVEWVEGDILDQPLLDDLMQGMDQVYHCAALISYDPRDAKKMIAINAEGTANVVNAALYAGIEKLVHLSSIAAIGRLEQQQHYDEKFIWQRSKLNTNYAISKYLAEQEVWRGIAEGLNAAILNPSVILGGGFARRGTFRLFEHVWHGNPFYPAGATGFVDVRDVALLAQKLMESSVSGERFIANGENWSYQDLFREMALQSHKKAPVYRATPLVSGLSWRIQWLHSRITGKAPYITRESSSNSSRTFYYQNQKSIDTFAMEYTPIRETVRQTCEAYFNQPEKERNAVFLPM